MEKDLTYQEIFKSLNNKGIDYLVVGGLAVNFHGIPRMTYDIDLMIMLDPENVKKTVEQLSQWGYKPRVPVDPFRLSDPETREFWIKEKNMTALNFYNERLPISEIDIVIDSPIPYAKLKANAVYVVIEDERVPVVSIPDLIELKLASGRQQDLSDVEYLRLIMERG
jgi:predicted nucleotidyltransferase